MCRMALLSPISAVLPSSPAFAYLEGSDTGQELTRKRRRKMVVDTDMSATSLQTAATSFAFCWDAEVGE